MLSCCSAPFDKRDSEVYLSHYFQCNKAPKWQKSPKSTIVLCEKQIKIFVAIHW